MIRFGVTPGFRDCVETRKIPPAGVGGIFRSALQSAGTDLLWEYHPREWVDVSSPAFARYFNISGGI